MLGGLAVTLQLPAVAIATPPRAEQDEPSHRDYQAGCPIITAPPAAHYRILHPHATTCGRITRLARREPMRYRNPFPRGSRVSIKHMITQRAASNKYQWSAGANSASAGRGGATAPT